MIPHVTNNEEVDITDLEAFRVQLNQEGSKEAIKYTLLAFLIKAAAATLKAFPAFNSSLGHEDGEPILIVKQYCHIGFAADTPNGLVVPVIRDVEHKGIGQIATECAELAKKARDGKLGPADMSGGTFTVSSLGGIGGTGFNPIINAPEVAILGVTRAQIRPLWDGQAFAPRLVLPLAGPGEWTVRVLGERNYYRTLLGGSGLARAFLVTVLYSRWLSRHDAVFCQRDELDGDVTGFSGG